MAQCLSGNYTIGGAAPDYPTITSAVSALTANGVCGPVNFNIRSGTYNEQVVIPAITGSSATNTITFQSESGDSTAVVLSFASTAALSNYTLKLNGADYFSFKKITIKSLNTTYARVVFITNGANHNLFLHNVIFGIPKPGYTYQNEFALFYSTASNDNYNTYDGNRMLNGTFGFCLAGINIPNPAVGTVIKNNFFQDQGWAPIDLVCHGSPVISGNTITSNFSVYLYLQGIRLEQCPGNYQIVKNKLVQGGIFIVNSQASPSAHSLIANNMVAAASHSGIDPSYYIHALYINYSSYIDIEYNSICLASGPGKYTVDLVNAPFVDLRNNILVSKVNGPVLFSTIAPVIGNHLTSDYNNVYNSGSAPLFNFNGVSYSSLAAWQAAQGQDLHSKNLDPYFTSPTNFRTQNGLLFGAANPVASVTDDIDGIVRSAVAPAIGAYEFPLPAADAGLLSYNGLVLSCNGGTIPVTVKLVNEGAGTLTSATINWQVNGIAQTPYHWTGTLNTLDSTTVLLGNYTLTTDLSHTIKSWTSNPNGLPDVTNTNDTLILSSSCRTDASLSAIIPFVNVCAGTLPVQVKLKNPGNNTLTSATIAWKVNGVSQTPYSWIGALNPMDSATVTIGNYNLASYTTYAFKAWTQNPNSETDVLHSNDTATLANVRAGMSGMYTIGGASPDFATFTAAVSALNTYGVCSPVVFNVRSGTYDEQVNILVIAGVSPANTITFQSEALDSTAVILTKSGAPAYVLQTQCPYMIIRKMTLKAVSLTTSMVIALSSGTGDVLQNNVIQSPIASSISGPLLVRIAGVANTDLVFDKNVFIGGSIGINALANGSRTRATNNLFQDQYSSAISVLYQDSLVVIGNNINTTVGAGNYTGIVMQVCTGRFIISKNKLTRGGIAVSIYSNPAVLPSLISNNVLYTNTAQVLNISTCTNLNIINNIIRSNSTAPALTLSGMGVGVTILNNIFSNYAGGLVISYTPAGAINFNHNDLYTTGTTLCYYAPTGYPNVTTLAQWQATGFDLNSYNIDPLFVSPTDLHPQSSYMNGNALVNAFVPDDVNGMARNASTPDLGAYEFSLALNDAATRSFAGVLPPCAGISAIKVIAGNSGDNTINSMTLNWQLNGVLQVPVNVTGTLSPGHDTTITLGTNNFIAGAAYVLKAWVSNPNGVADAAASNDTIIKTIYTGMGGVYTIGGALPDYSTFNAAISDLILKGVCSAVTFNVRAGTYPEQLSIPAIQGSSAVNTITFQSESGINTSVIVSNNAAGNTFTILLNNADHILFKSMSIKKTNGSTTIAKDINTIISLFNHSEYNVIDNNIITGATGYCISTGSTASTGSGHNVFSNNDFTNGGGGININGTAINACNKVLNNTFHNSPGAVTVNNQDSIIVSSNTILQTTTAPAYTISITLSKNIFVTKNKLDIISNGIGITLTADNTGLVANNFVHCGASPTYTLAGMGFGGSSGTFNVINNTVNMEDPHINSLGVSFSGTRLNFKNNIVINAGGGKAIYCVNGTLFNGFSNYNNLYSTGAFLGSSGSVSRTNLTAWRAATGMDSNSVSLNTTFVSPGDLHMSSYYTNNVGMPVSALITDDVDGDMRSTTMPDIGADEYTVTVTDASLLAFAGVYPSCAGSTPVNVQLLNSGGPVLTGSAIHWTVNGAIQPVYNWSGTLLSADTTIATIGNYNFVSGTLYNITAWVETANGIPDGLLPGDTAMMPNYSPALSGTYTIGGTAPNYATFNAAVADLRLKGICGPVIFNARPGTYTEEVTIPYIAGTSAVNTVLFQSENGDSTSVVLRYDALGFEAAFTLQFDSTAYVTVKKITITGSSSDPSLYGSLVFFTEHNQHISFSNNFVNGIIGGANSIYSGGYNNDYITISNNRIANGSYGIYFEGSFYYYPFTGQEPSKGLVISNNYFLGQAADAIHLFYHSSPVITRNTITATGYAISFRTVSGVPVISYNKLNGDIRFNSVISTAAARGRIFNNMISTQGYGVWFESNVHYQDLFYNSIYTYGGGIVMQTSSNIRSLNNSYSATDVSIYTYPAVLAYDTTDLEVSDHNNYYAAGIALGGVGYVGVPNLNAWQLATALDSNSVSGMPSFYSTTDLHLNLDTVLSNRGVPITGITDDIDGDPRSTTTPDIGADECSCPALDAALNSFHPFVSACSITQPVSVHFQNTGPVTLHTAVFNWSVNGVLQTPLNWTGNLISLDTTSVLLGNDVLAPGINIIKAWVSNPNGITDPVPSNDTIIQTITLPNPVMTSGAGAGSICTGSPLNIALTSTIPASYTWYATNNVNTTGESTTAQTGNMISDILINSSAVAQILTYTVTPVSMGCAGASQIITVTVDVPPVATIILSGASSFCQGNSVTLTSASASGNTWSTGDTTQSIIVNYSGSFTVNNSNACGSVTSAVVTTTMNLYPSMPVIMQGGDTLYSGVTSGNQWYLNGVAIPGATGQYYVPVQDGNYSVSVTVAGCTSTSADYVYTLSVHTGVQDVNANMSVSIYPNPYYDHTEISYALTAKSRVNIEVYNAPGEKISVLVNADQPAGNYHYVFSAKENGYGAGVYFVKITINGRSIMKRIVEMQ